MAGKASLLVVAGFSLLFLVISQNFGSVTNRAVDNYISYNTETIAHNIAVSGANMAANEIYRNGSWDDGFSDLPFQGGEINVEINVIDAVKNIRELVSTGTYPVDMPHSHTDTVRIILAPSKFSEYAYYSVSEGGTIWWTGNDTVWGPFHTQDYFRVYKHPVFLGKKTSHKKKIIYYTSKSKDSPVITGDYMPGFDLPLPMNAVDALEPIADDDGLKFSGKDTVYLTFDQDTLKYRYSYSANDTAVYLPSAAPNGLIFAKNCIVRMKGVVKGQYTVGISTSGDANKGTVYLDDDIVFDKDPRIYPTSTDLLGICAENNVYITQNTPNTSDIKIHASIYCEKGGFGAQNYDSRPPSGDIKLLGGIIQNTRKAVGTFDSKTGAIKTGFAKKYRYDDRLMVASPPFFPGTGGFKIVAWYE
jgi:hypothetical protein